jgi:hypothetical protein
MSNASAPDYLIASFWDDIDDESGDVYTDIFGTAPNRRFVVEWHNRPHYNNIGNATFETIFDEATGDIWFIYQDVNFGDALYDYGGSATVGVRSTTADGDYTQYSYNTASLQDGMAIHLVPTSATTYTIASAGPMCPPAPFGTHIITLTLRAVTPGVITNTANIQAGSSVCSVSDAVTVAGAIPTWDKDVIVNGTAYTPGDSPYTVLAGDEVTIVDRVMVTSDDPITYTLVETYTQSLDLLNFNATFGTVTTGTASINWDVTGGISGTWYILTKTFMVNGSDWVDHITETLTVTSGPPPQVIPLEFRIPATLSKGGPTEAFSGDVVTYTIVVEAPDPFSPLLHTALLTDVLPAGVTYAGGLTTTYGTAWYSSTANVVYWTNSTQSVMQTAFVPAGSLRSGVDVAPDTPLTSVALAKASATPPVEPTHATAILWDQPTSAANHEAYASQDFETANDNYDIFLYELSTSGDGIKSNFLLLEGRQLPEGYLKLPNNQGHYIFSFGVWGYPPGETHGTIAMYDENLNFIGTDTLPSKIWWDNYAMNISSNDYLVSGRQYFDTSPGVIGGEELRSVLYNLQRPNIPLNSYNYHMGTDTLSMPAET